MNIKTNMEVKTTEVVNRFTSPSMMLQGLITTLNYPCDCGQNEQSGQYSQQQVAQQIKGLQIEITNIREEVVQVQNLLSSRDRLYKQLDQLRQEREHIQSQIESSTVIERTQTVKVTGYRQMNERLKRRIYQVRQYIQKMTFQNQKIEDGIISNQYVQQEEELLIRKKQMQMQQAPVYEGKRYNMTNFQTMITKLHDKQDQAWKRVRRQEEDIQRRNIDARRKSGNAMTYYSPKSRTYFSPSSREIY